MGNSSSKDAWVRAAGAGPATGKRREHGGVAGSEGFEVDAARRGRVQQGQPAVGPGQQLERFGRALAAGGLRSRAIERMVLRRKPHWCRARPTAAPRRCAHRSLRRCHPGGRRKCSERRTPRWRHRPAAGCRCRPSARADHPRQAEISTSKAIGQPAAGAPARRWRALDLNRQRCSCRTPWRGLVSGHQRPLARAEALSPWHLPCFSAGGRLRLAGATSAGAGTVRRS